jgi:hypothetical protein
MNQAKRLLIYLVLNVIVSAITILGVLYLWENTRLKNLLINEPEGQVQINSTETTLILEEAPTNLLIEIKEVGGVGNLATEYVKLARSESENGETISLMGWRIKDQNNNDYLILEQSGLASLELHSQGAVNIYSKQGDSNPIELYLGLADPIWQPGETVSLIDPDGEIHDTYIIP